MTESECEAKEVKAFLYRICEFVDTLTFQWDVNVGSEVSQLEIKDQTS